MYLGIKTGENNCFSDVKSLVFFSGNTDSNTYISCLYICLYVSLAYIKNINSYCWLYFLIGQCVNLGRLYFILFFLNYWSVCVITCPKLSGQIKGPLRPLYPACYVVCIFVICSRIAACRPTFGICVSNEDWYQILCRKINVTLG